MALQREARGGDATERGLSTTDAHDLLSNRRRCAVVDTLRSEGELSVRELSERIAAREMGESPPPSDARRSVYVSLTQTHIPRLEQHDIVARENGTVMCGSSAENIYLYMESVPRYGITWNEFQGGCALLGVLLVVASAVGVPGLSAVPAAVWGVVALSALVVLAAYRSYRRGSSVLDRVGD